MNKPINVLIFPAGEINSVELHDALSSVVNIKLYGGSSVDRHGPYIFENYIENIPYIQDEEFIDKFNAIIKKYKIDIIFPTHDTVVAYFANNHDRIKAKIIPSDIKTAEICRDKRLTYELFTDCDFIPKVYKDELEAADYPVFAKPAVGQGSVGAKIIDNLHDLEQIDLSKYVVCEYLPGIEYTVDCLTDTSGKLKIASPRSRDRTMAGVSVSGKSVHITEEIQKIAETINSRLKFKGLWYFQIKKDKNEVFKLLEISNRCAGGMCLTRAKGVNLPLLSIYAELGYDIDVVQNTYEIKMDRTLINRYKIDYEYDNIYIDFDDTIIINNKVSLDIIKFLYQSSNSGKNIYLITKHSKDVSKTLNDYAISDKLFKDILVINETSDKADKVDPLRAIFIDNAFAERKAIADKYGIPVFDVDTIEALLDWRS